MEIKKIKEQAKKFVMVNKYSPLVQYAAVLTVIAIFALVASQIVWFALVFIPLFFLYAPVAYSAADYYMRSYNLKAEESFKLFEGFKGENFFRSLLLSMIRTGFGICFLVGFAVGFGVAFGIGMGAPVAVGIGFAATVPFLVPAAIYYARTAIALYLLRMDQKLSPWGAFTMSVNLMKGKAFQLVKLFLSYLGWFALGILTVGMFLIYAVPHYQTAKSIFFRREILGLDDDQEMPDLSNITLSARSKKDGNVEDADGDEETAGAPEKKRKKFDRNVIPEEMDFDRQTEEILNLIRAPETAGHNRIPEAVSMNHVPEVEIPKNIKEDVSKEFEIRENETFDEYRARVQRAHAVRTGMPLPQDTAAKLPPQSQAQKAAEENARLIKEAEEKAAEEERILEEYFKTDEHVAQIVEEQILQKTADIKADGAQAASPESIMQEPDPLLTEIESESPARPSVEPAAETEAQARKRAVAERVAQLKTGAKFKTAEKTGERATLDRRAHEFTRTRERSTAVREENPVSPHKSASREEILERLRREREKKT